MADITAGDLFRVLGQKEMEIQTLREELRLLEQRAQKLEELLADVESAEPALAES